MVMRALHEEVTKLTSTESGRTGGRPIDRLARTQALFIYQVMRLLDGNVTLRASGERDIPLLVAWMEDLASLRDNLDDLSRLDGNATRQQPPVEWEVS